MRYQLPRWTNRNRMAWCWTIICTWAVSTGHSQCEIWQPLGNGIAGEVDAMTVFNNELVVSGTFLQAGGQPAQNIARWNGSTWQTVGTGTNNSTFAVAAYNGELVAGGAFTSAGSQPANMI